MTNRVQLTIDATERPPAPLSGTVRAKMTSNIVYVEGDLSGQVNRVIRSDIVIPGSSTVSLDLLLTEDRYGDPLSLGNVLAADFFAADANGANLELRSNVTNGWAPLAGAAGKILLKPGCGHLVRAPAGSTDLPVSGSSKVIEVANLDASPAQVSVLLLGGN